MPGTDAAGDGLAIQVLTCRSAPKARMHSANRQLAGIADHFPISVVDGNIPDDAALEALYDAGTNRRRTNRSLSRSEIAVYATHRTAWQNLLANGHDCCLILEDDFGIRDRVAFDATIRSWKMLCSHGDIIKLFDFLKGYENKPAYAHQAGLLNLVKWRNPTAGAVAYFITRRGAEKMLARSRIFRPIDEDFKHFWELGLHVWSVTPSPVAEISAALGGSLIDGDRKLTKSRKLTDRLRGNLINVHRKLLCRFHYFLEYRAQPAANPSSRRIP
jgi:GR25 family glycosyltransferase involved in LPS biosynthesis